MNRLRLTLLGRRLRQALQACGLDWHGIRVGRRALKVYDADGHRLDSVEIVIQPDHESAIVALSCGSNCRGRFRLGAVDSMAAWIASHDCVGLRNVGVHRNSRKVGVV